MADLGPEARLGPYRVVERLGEGAMGVVYRAVREPDGTDVALKVLKPELSVDATFRRRFEHEARAAGEVHHRHLVPIVDAGEADGRAYLAVAFVDGETLERRLEREGAAKLDDGVRVASHIGSALDALHRAGIVHRDVKPGNVMVDRDGAAWLTDFGLAKGRAYTVLTRPGMVVGTLDYMAPELFRGAEATPASDVYALGAMVYEVVTGTPPFGDRSMFDLANAVLREPPPDPTTRVPELPPGVGEVLLRALAKAPEDRPPTGKTFASLLAAGAGRFLS